MSHWIISSSLEVESFILKHTTVVQLDDFSMNHSSYLVSTSAAPQEASKYWIFQRNITTPGEGWVSLRLNGQEIMPLDAWTNITFFWENVLNLATDFLRTGKGEGTFSDEPADFSLALKAKDLAVFSLRNDKYIVNPRDFLVSLLEGAKSFYGWADEYVGNFPPSFLERTRTLIAELKIESS